MELSTLITAFCLAVSFMLHPWASVQINAQKSLKQHGNFAVHQPQFSLLLLPRKLKLREEAVVKSSADEGIMPHRKLMDAPSGNKQEEVEENLMQQQQHHQAGKGTWREWVEAPNRSEYFTMDYRGVRRRRPIHNMQIPFVP